ncbi:MAG: hypothetical protein R2873_29330 [Caldilineaceae bacterium]
MLAVYWPQETGGALTAVPTHPGSATTSWLHKKNETGPTLLTTGSVDGEPSLGWGLAESDFYAMPSAQALTALDNVAADHARIWHYRLYDTVSDPAGLLRAKLDTLGALTVDMPFPDRDFVRLQRYDLPTADTLFCPEDGASALWRRCGWLAARRALRCRQVASSTPRCAGKRWTT